MAPHSSTLAWKIPWMEEPARLQSMGSLRVGHDWELHFHFSLSCIGEENGNPLWCSCLENPRDGRAWWAAVYGVAQSQTRLKQLSRSSSGSRTILQKKKNLILKKGGRTELGLRMLTLGVMVWALVTQLANRGHSLPLTFIPRHHLLFPGPANLWLECTEDSQEAAWSGRQSEGEFLV